MICTPRTEQQNAVQKPVCLGDRRTVRRLCPVLDEKPGWLVTARAGATRLRVSRLRALAAPRVWRHGAADYSAAGFSITDTLTALARLRGRDG